FNEDGTWGNKRKKINGKSVHLTDWYKDETLMKWRKSLADNINALFKEKGINDRVSHESYAKQNIDKTPQLRLSREAYQYEERMKKKQGAFYTPHTYYAKLNKEIDDLNREIHQEQKLLVGTDGDQNDTMRVHRIRDNYPLSDQEK